VESSGKLSCAVIGGGAAGHGALLGLRDSSVTVSATLIDPPAGPRSPFEPERYPQEAGPERGAYLRHLRASLGRSLVPPKSHFGIRPETYDVTGWGPIWRGDTAGGLTRFWGASALPLPESGFRNWPFGMSALRPHYEAIVSELPVAGRDDCLSALWGHGLASRPPLSRPAIFDRLAAALEAALPGADGAYDLIPGSGRMAIETASGATTACRYCGDCMAGCRFGAIYSAGDALAERRDLYDARVEAHVIAVDRAAGTLTIEQKGARRVLGPFDRIYLAAGCIGSTAILARSGLAPRETEVQDNAVLTFLLAYLGGPVFAAASTRYLALTNLVVACRPRRQEDPVAALQLYPFFDYLWELHTPHLLAPALRGLSSLLRERLVIARLYLPAAMSQRYSLRVSGDGMPALSLKAAPADDDACAPLLRAVRAGLNRGGFFALPRPLLRHGTSSHYAGTLPLGGGYVDKQGRVAPGVYLCDSAAFPESPAFSPTLTIMAFAHHVASRSAAAPP
jgi:choline dehydrogenase-like flavoprotein